MSDPNAKRKRDILDRAKRSGNRKVEKYIEGGLFPKLDHLGPHAGVFLESLEHDYDKFAKPEGLLHGFTPEDFDDLHQAMFDTPRE